MLLAFGLLFLGGDSLVHGAGKISELLGLPRIFVGMVVVGIGTSAPELAFGIGSALSHHGNLVAGNVIGSNIVNIGLALGIAWLIASMPSSVTLHRRDLAILLFVTVASIALLLDGTVGRIEGLLLFMLAVGFTALGYSDSVRENAVEGGADNEEPGLTEGVDGSDKSALGKAVMWLILGIVLLIGGAELLVVAAVDIASALGVSEAVISLTLTAFGTGIPEVTATAIAAFRREFELAVGNIVGSNIMNLTLVLGLSASVVPLTDIDIGYASNAAVLTFTVAFIGFLMLRFTNRIASVLLLLGYALYLFLTFAR